MMPSRRVAAVGFLVAFGCAGAPGSRDAVTAGAAAPTAGEAAPTNAGAAEAASGALVYVGLAGGEIALFQLDAATGTLARRKGATAAGRGPVSLLRSVERGTLIAVDGPTGQVTSFAVDAKSGALKVVGRAAAGAGPTAGAALDDSGRYVVTAHPAAGRVAVVAITQAGGLKAIDTFAAGAGARAVAMHPAQVAFVSNFRAGSVAQYAFTMGTGMLTPKRGEALELPAGSQPARLVCHPSGRWVYLLDEGRGAVAVFRFGDDLKALSPISSQVISALPEGAKRGRPIDLAVSPTGKFLYVTTHGPNGIAAFEIDAAGTLKLVGHVPGGGGAPGALAIDPSGRVLVVANEGRKSLGVYSIDPTSGALTEGRSVALAAKPLSLLAVRP